MLCFEGIALNLNIFMGRISPPNFRVVEPKDGILQTITVSPECSKVRPYVSGAILRNIKFTKDRYESFIALQDKLHQNLARQRTLVSIGTHDLDTIKGPFTYEALPPRDFKFVPLNQTQELTGETLMTFYETTDISDATYTSSRMPPYTPSFSTPTASSARCPPSSTATTPRSPSIPQTSSSRSPPPTSPNWTLSPT